MKTRQSTQRGITLIEVLVSMAIFAAGILGMVSLQLSVQQRIEDQQNRSAVMWKSAELIERIKSNKTDDGIAQYFNNLQDDDFCENPVAVVCADTYDENGNLTLAQACTVQQMANYDVWETLCTNREGIREQVSAFTYDITCSTNPCSSTSDITLTFQWSSKAAAQDPRLTQTIINMDGDEVEASTDWYRVQFRP